MLVETPETIDFRKENSVDCADLPAELYSEQDAALMKAMFAVQLSWGLCADQAH